MRTLLLFLLPSVALADNPGAFAVRNDWSELTSEGLSRAWEDVNHARILGALLGD